MKFIKQFFVVLALFILQYTLFSRFKIWGVIPNALLAYVVVTATSKDLNEAVFAALFAAVLGDLLQNRFFGLDVFFYLFIALLFYEICDKYIHANFMVTSLLIFATNLLYSIYFFIINYIATKDGGFWGYLLKHGLFSSLYITVIMFFILLFFDDRLYRQKELRQIR